MEVLEIPLELKVLQGSLPVTSEFLGSQQSPWGVFWKG